MEIEVQVIQKNELPDATRNRISIMIRSAKVRLQKYQKECRTHPKSIYYQNLIDNTTREIEQLKLQIA
jgi:hypothetical protein